MKSSRHHIFWAVLLGFLAAYVLLFIVPVFLHDSNKMMFYRYVPTLPTRGIIGEDAKSIRLFVLDWLHGLDPYLVEEISNGVFYPPLVLLLLLPLGLVDAQSAYVLMLTLTLACFVALALWLPVAFSKRPTPIVLLFFATGLFSYGLQFELERGQYNVIAVFLSLLGVYLFQFHGENRLVRLISYVLMTTAIQLKLYPAIFSIGLMRDWTRWRDGLKRLMVIGAVNVLLLFGMGQGLFLSFARSLHLYSRDIFGEKINHSAASFASYALGVLGGDVPGSALRPSVALFASAASLSPIVFVALFAIILGACILIAARGRIQGLPPPVLLSCTLGALMIPSTSFDYTLSFLPPAMAIYLQHLTDKSSAGSGDSSSAARQGLRLLGVAVMSLAYFSTIFSYTNKPDVFFIANNFPALFVILLLTPLLAIL